MQEIFSPKAVLESYIFRLKKEVWFEEIVTNQEGLRLSGVSACCDSNLSDLRQVPLCLGSRPGRLSFEGMFPGKREKPVKRGKQIIDYLDFFFAQKPIFSFQLSYTKPWEKTESLLQQQSMLESWTMNVREKKTQLVEFGAIPETWLNHDFSVPMILLSFKNSQKVFSEHLHCVKCILLRHTLLFLIDIIIGYILRGEMWAFNECIQHDQVTGISLPQKCIISLGNVQNPLW